MARRRHINAHHPGPGSPELREYWLRCYTHFKPLVPAHFENGGGVREYMRIKAEKRAWAAAAGLKWFPGRGWERGTSMIDANVFATRACRGHA